MFPLRARVEDNKLSTREGYTSNRKRGSAVIQFVRSLKTWWGTCLV